MLQSCINWISFLGRVLFVYLWCYHLILYCLQTHIHDTRLNQWAYWWYIPGRVHCMIWILLQLSTAIVYHDTLASSLGSLILSTKEMDTSTQNHVNDINTRYRCKEILWSDPPSFQCTQKKCGNMSRKINIMGILYTFDIMSDVRSRTVSKLKHQRWLGLSRPPACS